jgi:hypothetical protein
MSTIDNYKELGYAIAIQAAKDCEKIDGKETSPQKRSAIIKSLRSEYMNFITGGMASMLADALRKDWKAVVRRIKNMEEEELQCDIQ